MNQCLIILPPEYFHYPPCFQSKNLTFATLEKERKLNRSRKVSQNCFWNRYWGRAGQLLRWCYTERFATTIFSATQPCNIVLNSHNIVPALQRCTVKHHTFKDLTIRQRRRPWKRPWKIDFASFLFYFAIIPSCPVTLKRREFRLEMKRGERDQVQTEMIEFIGLPFPFSSNLKFGHFTS